MFSREKIVALILAFLIGFPAFLPWLPHGAAHAFHDYGHASITHDHAKKSHDHKEVNANNNHHAIQIDILAYFNDFLNVELRSSKLTKVKAPAQDLQDSKFFIVADFLKPPSFQIYGMQSPKIPVRDRHIYSPAAPLYLTTQRLRI